MVYNFFNKLDNFRYGKNRPVQSCNQKSKSCNNYNKNIPGSSGNTNIVNTTQKLRISYAIERSNHHNAVKWVTRTIPVNEYGRRPGGPHGSGSSPKNTFN